MKRDAIDRDGGEVRRRDRAATERRILDAARILIARDGFAALGVNALAAEAGCDKKLISRYFGDLDGVVIALAGDLGFWVGDAPAPEAGGDYGHRMEAMFRAYETTLRSNVLLQRVLAWELVDPSPALSTLEARRTLAIGDWMAGARGDATAPPGVDAPAINAVLLAALHYLTLRERTLQGFAGMDLTTPEARERIDRAFETILKAVYGPRT